jgi:putative tryptophan/tyrosine transport system substrate-binding protein
MKTKLPFWLLASVLLITAPPAGAQRTEKVYRIGYLSASAVNEAFRQGLRDLGYIEGKNLAIEFRQAEVNERYPELAAELARLRVDLIFTVGVLATRAAKEATTRVPIVMGNASTDPVRHGLVGSLARPGGNVTGLIDLLPNLAGKRLEILKETFPKLSRAAHLSVRGSPVGVEHRKETEAVARALGVRVQALDLRGPDDLESAFRAARDGGAEALIVVGVSFFIPHHQRIVDLQLKNRLPAMHTHGRWVPAGGLMSYTTDGTARYRRAAEYVDRVLKGTKPADLPIERPTKFVFEVNLKTAKQIGVTIPQSVLIRADKVIR